MLPVTLPKIRYNKENPVSRNSSEPLAASLAGGIQEIIRKLGGASAGQDDRTLINLFGEAVGRGIIKELRDGGLLPQPAASQAATPGQAAGASPSAPPAPETSPNPKKKKDHECRNVMGGYTGRCSICAQPIQREN
ncbi:MAG: hypothetical protein CSB33_05010 [Desulfobacterales bacterium]|nr:MAG: hypothetical protein CSB33_05010 [Desulfobacterales bacterium]